MKNISLSTKSIFAVDAAARLIFIEQNSDLKKKVKPLLEMYPNLIDLANQRNFHGAAQDVMVLPLSSGVQYVILVGLGQKDGKTIKFESYRRALAKAVRAAISLRLPSIAIELPQVNLFGVSIDY